MMHLDECFQQGSILIGIKCIASDWALKSQTSFYIPSESYAGYSYLFDSLGNEQHRHVHDGHDLSQPHYPLFVTAHQYSTLHPHYNPYTSIHSHLNQTDFMITRNSSVYHSSTLLTNSFSPFVHARKTGTSSHVLMMTIPYIHPHLDRPVPPLQLPWYFGALCFTFPLGGLTALYWTPKWVRRGGRHHKVTGLQQRHWYPYRIFGWGLVLFQGPCSFLADYVYMTHISQWHIIDRMLASTLMSLEILKYIVMRPYTRPMIYALYIFFVSAAAFCFMKSQVSQRELDTNGFIFWHCAWHCYPLAASAICWLENWLICYYGEHYVFECDRFGPNQVGNNGEPHSMERKKV